VKVREVKLMIGIPSRDEVHAQFMSCCFDLMRVLTQTPLPEPFVLKGFQFMNIRGSILSRSREKLVDKARKENCTHLLFIDSDMDFPKEIAHRLLAINQPIVACNCSTKENPPNPTARYQTDTPFGVPVLTTKVKADAHQFEYVWRVGTGVMLVDLDAIASLQSPLFEVKWADYGDYVGEDWYFCQRLQEIGIKPIVDHWASWHTGHIGNIPFTHELVIAGIKMKQFHAERKRKLEEVASVAVDSNADTSGLSSTEGKSGTGAGTGLPEVA
jgi:hypothetical protein